MNLRRIIFLVLSVVIVINIALVNDKIQAKQKSLQGYVKSLSGLTMNYHSPHPDVNSALITRTNNKFKPIEWETEIIPEDYENDYVTLTWMFGIGVKHESHSFDLYINGQKWFTFSNPTNTESELWQINGRNGATLTFRATLIDQYNDLMGFATLKIPKKDMIIAKPLVLKVDGEDAESYNWYMTFEGSLESEITVTQQDCIVREGQKQFQIVQVSIIHLDAEIEAHLGVENGQMKKVKLQPGVNSISLKVPVVKKSNSIKIKIKIGDQPEIIKPCDLKPVRKWTMYLVTHSHTDIGYTRPQTDILPEHLRFIDYALDLCDQTDDFPDDARFRWTCESSWAVREYLKRRPIAQIDRLKKRIQEGRIEVTAMFFNMSEIIDEATLAAQLQPIKMFKDFGIPVKAVMQNDVNGIGWCLVDYFADTDVKYLIMGEHGHRALIPFDKPTVFWWKSPAGKKIMAFRAEHYMTGNFFGIHTGNLKSFEPNVFSYLKGLGNKHYPFDQISIQFSGYVTDNSPPATISCDLIKTWNEKYEWPKLRNATASEFMEHIENHHSADLPVIQAAWPDWWTDGFGSAARETAAARTTHSSMLANQTLLSLAAMYGAKISSRAMNDLTDIQDALLFYDEHTFGAAESISDPTAENSMVQWGEKSAYAWEAVKRSALFREEAFGLIQPYIKKSDVPIITVFNTLNWERSGLVKCWIDHEILPLNKKFKLIDEAGNEIQAQTLNSRSDGSNWGILVENVPPVGCKTYRIEVSNESVEPQPKKIYEGILENKYYSLKIDANTGAITSLYDKQMQQELVDANCSWQLGQFIYEQLKNRDELNNKTAVTDPKRSALTNVEIKNIYEGPAWKSLFINGQAPDCVDSRGVYIEIRLYNKAKQIELHFGMRKLPVTSAEAVYVAFPFNLPDSKIIFEAQGGLVVPGKDQLEGTASDWNTIQNFAVVRSSRGQVVFGSNEIPLVQFGDINIGKYQYIAKPEHNHIYSWVLNNYWVTNFKASQEGELKWSYYLTSSNDKSNGFASRFGWENRVPFLARVMPAGKEKKVNKSSSLLNIDAPNILLINIKPSLNNNGVILYLREIEGQPAKIAASELSNLIKIKKVEHVNVLEEKIKELDSEIIFKPFEAKFLRLEF